MGRASGCFGPDYSSLNFENIIDPEAATGSIEGMLIKVLEKTPYTLPGSDQLNHPLPAGIEPTEYCFCAEPWDKVFHLLMQMTD
ncbi:hypothetical protein LLG95_04010 [bacterium]|nr:hypothetical protein [bacterium]